MYSATLLSHTYCKCASKGGTRTIYFCLDILGVEGSVTNGNPTGAQDHTAGGGACEIWRHLQRRTRGRSTAHCLQLHSGGRYTQTLIHSQVADEENNMSQHMSC
jgi:hypothetical protein